MKFYKLLIGILIVSGQVFAIQNELTEKFISSFSKSNDSLAKAFTVLEAELRANGFQINSIAPQLKPTQVENSKSGIAKIFLFYSRISPELSQETMLVVEKIDITLNAGYLMDTDNHIIPGAILDYHLSRSFEYKQKSGDSSSAGRR